MGRKIEIKKIENATRRQVTYSKRRGSLIKKANEISVFCDTDVVFIAFAPSGRVNSFCSRDRMEDVLERYINLPSYSRYPGFKNIQGKTLKLRELDQTMDDESKLQHLNNQIQRLEEQIKRKKSEIGILHHKLKEYEPNPEDTSLSQVLSLEEHFNNSLKLVEDRKKFLIADGSSPPTESTTKKLLIAHPSSFPPTESITKKPLITNRSTSQTIESTTEGDNDHNNEEAEKISRKGRSRDHQHQLQQNIDEYQLIYELQDPTSSHILLQLDPCLSSAHPYRWSNAQKNMTMSDLIETDEGTSARNEGDGVVSNNSISSLPEVTTGLSSNNDQYCCNWFTAATHAPIEGISFGEKHVHGQVDSWENGMAQKRSNLDVITNNTNELNWFPSCDYNINYTTQNISASLPSNSKGTNVSGCNIYEPYFMTNAVAGTDYIPTTINSSEISENNINGSDANCFDKVMPIPESSAQAETNNNNNIMCSNQNEEDMDGFWDSDDSLLLQNLDFEDLEFIFG